MSGNMVRIGTLAKQWGEPKRTVFRRLFRLQAMSVARFMVRPSGDNGHWRVNVSVLREQHPGCFPAIAVSERLDRLEAITDEHAVALARMAPVLGKVRQRVGV